MGQPLPPDQQGLPQDAQGLVGPQSPITMEQLIQLRTAAMGQQDLSAAAGRRLGGEPIVGNKTPEDLMLEQAAQDSQVDPPDINPEAAKTMMLYGSVMDFLMRAKGELANG